MTTHSISLGAFNTEATDPSSLSAFWSAVTGGATSPAGESVFLAPASDGFAMFFQPRTSPRPDHQASHLDLTVPWGSRQSEVDRIVALGAVYRWEVLDEYPHVKWTTLEDPEGNLFCIAEHPPT